MCVLCVCVCYVCVCVCVCSSASVADDEREEKKLLGSSGTDARNLQLQVPQEETDCFKLKEPDGQVAQGARGETETEAQLRELLKTEREQKVVAISTCRMIHV